MSKPASKINKYLLLLLILINLVGLFFLKPKTINIRAYFLVKKIEQYERVADRKPYLYKLLDLVGPIKTQELLLNSNIGYTGDSHLLVHYVGQYVYDNYKEGGLTLCREYFLGACYHQYIINYLSEKGVDNLKDSLEECQKDGNVILSQCSHAIGHGLMAWTDYDLDKSLEECDSISASTDLLQLDSCYDGVFMENIFGIHNLEDSEIRFFNSDDPQYPCNISTLTPKQKTMCWVNQGTIVSKIFEGDIKKSAEVCLEIDKQYQWACFTK